MTTTQDQQGPPVVVIPIKMAWTIFVTLAGVLFYGAMQVASLEEVVRRQERHDLRISAVEMRISSIERDAAVASSQRGTILALVEKIDARLARMEGRP